MSHLSRVTLAVAHCCLADAQGTPALVFCSRYGEYQRTFGLLQALAAGEPLSPAGFSVSVHNTSAGLCTIHEGRNSHATAIAAGEATLEYGFMDCASLLLGGDAEEALLVYHDEPLPELYDRPHGDFPTGIALAMMLRRPDEGESDISLSWSGGAEGARGGQSVGCAMDVAGRLIRLLTGRQETWVHDHGRTQWTWCHNAAA